MSDAFWMSLFGFLGLLFTQWMLYLRAGKTQATAIKAQEIADKTQTEVGKVKSVAVATHRMVNGNLGVQLEKTASALRLVAELRQEPGDEAEAATAERLLAEYRAKEAQVEAASKKDAPAQ